MELKSETRLKLMRFFILSAGSILVGTGMAKLVSSFGSARVLATADPLFLAPFRYVFAVVGVIEVAIGFACFRRGSLKLKASLVAWLATAFLIYRLGLWLINYRMPCGCLGSLTSFLGISSSTADGILRCALCYLMVGAYGLLLWDWKNSERSLRTEAGGG